MSQYLNFNCNTFKFLIAGLAMTASANAATLMGSFSAIDGTTVYDLTTAGDLDWAYWNTSSNPTTGVPANSMLSATLIATPVAIGGGSLRGSNSDTTADFSYTNGTSPESGTTNNVSGIFNTLLNTVGAGVSLDITLPNAGTAYLITIWGSQYNTETGGTSAGLFTASLSGASDYTNDEFSAPVSTFKQSGIYQLTAVADNDNDVLNIAYIQQTLVGANTHVLLDAAAISIPEPATYGMLLGVVVLMAVIQRRHQKR
ncbi:PEP-CTERM sorting domain-containing protein [Cerasicoccus arenae]|uniref:PEP-CTERM sorting domain-containing protein n=1 Tax=Cerasicoccus arenae TaxID=424488 RepID=A0A8J3GCS7_9BACT|nr:PEP-CTERM sorting domain-containing protein [Cerasicoccus arenae]MBK1859620.1 hypothetical protein [Cerasicoccus arenae]GHB96307.1 hypothetical protein GCM10007047_10130 [Cerasicoccus arenae]